jgi:hypothetical protein
MSADHAGYFAFAMGNDRRAIIDFFKRVLDASPIPVMIYNFPLVHFLHIQVLHELTVLVELPRALISLLTSSSSSPSTPTASVPRSALFDSLTVQI